MSSPAVVNGVVYIGVGCGVTLFALNAGTGTEPWADDIGGDPLTSSAAVANGIVYIGATFNSQSGALLALDAKTGAQVWSYPRVSNIDSDTFPLLWGETSIEVCI